jgi:hypothetical protein
MLGKLIQRKGAKMQRRKVTRNIGSRSVWSAKVLFRFRLGNNCSHDRFCLASLKKSERGLSHSKRSAIQDALLLCAFALNLLLAGG